MLFYGIGQIRFYRLYADSSGSTGLPVVLDRGGHGTHVAGSLVGESLGEKSEFNGIASGAKIAFHDLGNEDAARGIQTPWDLQTGYFRQTLTAPTDPSRSPYLPGPWGFIHLPISSVPFLLLSVSHLFLFCLYIRPPLVFSQRMSFGLLIRSSCSASAFASIRSPCRNQLCRLRRWSYLYGARVHSDSWGSDDSGYDSLAWDVDAFSWNNPDFLAVFAAGNDGEEGEATVFSPATSKNGLTVGATLSADGYPLPRSDVKQLGSVYKVVMPISFSPSPFAQDLLLHLPLLVLRGFFPPSSRCSPHPWLVCVICEWAGHIWKRLDRRPALQASISGGLVGGWLSGDRFNVLQSMMGGALTSVLGKSFNLVAADPITACSDLINAASVNGKASTPCPSKLWPLLPFLVPSSTFAEVFCPDYSARALACSVLAKLPATNQ